MSALSVSLKRKDENPVKGSRRIISLEENNFMNKINALILCLALGVVGAVYAASHSHHAADGHGGDGETSCVSGATCCKVGGSCCTAHRADK